MRATRHRDPLLLALVCGCGAWSCGRIGYVALPPPPRDVPAADVLADGDAPSVQPPDAPADRAAPPDVPPDVTVERGVTAVSAGQTHTCAVITGAAYCWGANAAGALGQGDTMNRATPTRVPLPEQPVVDVAAGDEASCARVASGATYCWGDNSRGQLARGDTVDSAVPVRTMGRDGWAQLTADHAFACTVGPDARASCWGQNDEGQLSQDDPFPAAGVDRLTPVEPRGGPMLWRQLATGQGHGCGIDSGGAAWCWGRNVSGELGAGMGTPGQIRVPLAVSAPAGWAQLDLGQSHSCGVRADGTLWCWGVNGSGQVGVPGAASYFAPARVGTGADWTAVSAGAFATCGLRRPGSLWCWGRNDEGQLGSTDGVGHPVPVQVGAETDWVAVSMGRFHVCAIRAGGRLLCGGDNGGGAVGQGLPINRQPLALVAGP